MKKLSSVGAALAIAALSTATVLLVGCKHDDAHTHGGGHVHQYTCEHHPEVVQSTPGNCPKCGMKLVHKE